jgi:hypothetical protein
MYEYIIKQGKPERVESDGNKIIIYKLIFYVQDTKNINRKNKRNT